MTQPILTISILVSNRIDTVRKCLDSIQPLLNAVPSELILTDTGCGEEVRGIIEEYTNQIIEFTWCQDFSAARNVGLKQAKGQWFMYLDDDEWFEDVLDIIDFFQSGECDKYSVACYIQRNYYAFKADTYRDHSVDRILRINPKLHFEHRVHEKYVDIETMNGGKKKRLTSYVHHYGYIKLDSNETRKKYERNQELLELECAEHPEDMRMWHQLVTNQFCEKKWDKGIEIALPLLDQESDSEYWDLIHTEFLRCLEGKKDWNQMVRYCRKFFKKEMHLYEMFGTLQYGILGFFRLEQYREASVVAEEAFELYERYKKNPEEFNKCQLMLKTFFEDEYVGRMLAMGLASAIYAGEIEVCHKLMSYNNSEEIKRLLMGEDLQNAFILLAALGTIENIKEITDTVCFSWLGTMTIEDKSNRMTQLICKLPNEMFDKWNDVVLSLLQPNTSEELYWFMLMFDRKLQEIAWYADGKTLTEKVDAVFELLSGYSETMIYYCNITYDDKGTLAPKERAAYIIPQMIQSISDGKIEEGISHLKDLLSVVPEWNNALGYLIEWIGCMLY